MPICQPLHLGELRSERHCCGHLNTGGRLDLALLLQALFCPLVVAAFALVASQDIIDWLPLLTTPAHTRELPAQLEVAVAIGPVLMAWRLLYAR